MLNTKNYQKQMVKFRFLSKKKTIYLSLFMLMIFSSVVKSQNVWVQKTNFPGAARYHATGFTIGDKIYVTTGWNNSTNYNDLWEYNTITDTWMQKTNFPGAARYAAVGFSIGNKGYVCCGRYGNTYLKDLWEYDQSSDTWTQKTDFGGTGRHHPIAFVIDSIAYVGTGENSVFKKDMWAYYPITDNWTQKADFGGTARHAAFGFTNGGNALGFVGGGTSSAGYLKDFWQYYAQTDTWTQLADFGTVAKEHAVGFGYYVNRAVVGTGWDGSGDTDDMWEYDFISGTWMPVAPFGGGIREGAVGFAVNSFGYMGTGWDGSNKNDWWVFFPPFTGVENFSANDMDVKIFPNPANDYVTIKFNTSHTAKTTLSLTDLSGRKITQWNLMNSTNEIRLSLSDVASGFYLLKIKTTQNSQSQKLFITKK
ncbi:MAG: kelch repeat-containing protein [Bacteroidia bacterium]